MLSPIDKDKVSLFGSDYSPAKLLDKITTVAKKAGIKPIYAALLLYYMLTDGEVPAKDKMLVVGALGYFILPLDIIPDFVLGGFADDITVLVTALKTVWDNITPKTHQRARAKLKDWFDSVNDEDLTLF